VGLGHELEARTVAAALSAAQGLPPGAWLDLNVSPGFLVDGDRLRRLTSSSCADGRKMPDDYRMPSQGPTDPSEAPGR
jgi:hypothetical protein